MGYPCTAFQIQKATTASRTYGSSALKTHSTSKTRRVETAARLMRAFTPSVMQRQRGIREIDIGFIASAKLLNR